MGTSTNYVRIESTPEQDLQSEMNTIDRKFYAGYIKEGEWNRDQIKVIKKYKNIILKNHDRIRK